MRAAVSLALFQAPNPPNSMAAAKVRLRLYAGLNEWALEAIFAPQPGVIAGCVREIGASQSECEALVAAAAKSSVAQIRSIAGGPAAAAAPAPAYAAPAPAPAAPGGSRFGRFNSGFQAAPAAQQQYAAPQGYAPPRQQGYAPPRQQGYAPPPQQGYNAPRYAPPQQQASARPVAPAYQRPVAPPPAAPVVSQQEQLSRKEAYKAQREAYLARQKQQFEERKNKIGAAGGGEPAEPPAAAPVAAAPSKSASASAAKGSAKAAAAEPESDATDAPAEPVAAKSTAKALDGDFLDGLLDDPLGGKGKK